MELEKVERERIEREKYAEQLKKFFLRSKELDESLTSFFSQVFSKDVFVTPNFFRLVEKLKTLDGGYVKSLLGAKDDLALAEIARHHCMSETHPNAEYVFDGSVISYNKKVMSRTFYDPDRKVSLSDLRGMGDFTCLSFLNAFDLPYLTDTRIDRSSFEHFMSAFLDEIVLGENPKNAEILRFNLVKQASADLGYTIQSWVQILYLITHIMQNIYRLAFDAMQEKLPEYYPMVEKIKFIEQFTFARRESLETKKMPDTTELWRDFLRIDFTRITEGNSRERIDKTPLALLDDDMKLLDPFILGARASSDMAMDSFKQYRLKEKLPGACKEFCEISIRFQLAFEHFLTSITGEKSAYQLALKSGVQLLKVLYPESFPNVALETPTPRSKRGTPRDDSPRILGQSSPRALMRASTGSVSNPQASASKETRAAQAAQIEMWKMRKSAGGGSPSPEPGGKSPGLVRQPGGSDGK